MISSLTGTAAHIGLDRIVVEVSGVGLTVLTTPGTASAHRTGQNVTLATSLVVREDSLTLFGFDSGDERDLFEIVQTVSGVGPRLALAMLAVLPPETLRLAVSQGDVATLTKVPGIGKKGAERIVLELRDKIGAPTQTAGATPVPAAPSGDALRDPVREALLGLGWNAKQADGAVESVIERDGDTLTVPALLKAALRELGR